MKEFIPHKAYPLEHPTLKQAQDRRIKDDLAAWKQAGGVVIQLGWGDKSLRVDNRKKTRAQRALDIRSSAKQSAEPDMFVSLETAAAEEEE